MKPGLWTKLCSYLLDMSLEKVESNFSGPLELVLRNNRYALCTQNAVYSYDDLYHNFRLAFQQISIDQLAVKKVLVLGLGLGSIPFMLENKFKQNYHYTLVEIDPVIIDFAQKYRLKYLSSTLEVIESDAFEFVKWNKDKYDLIAVDLFIDDAVPVAFEQHQFLKNVKLLMHTDAILLFNRLAYNEEHLLKTEDFFNKIFLKVFEEGNMLSVLSNRMLINRRSF